MYQFCHHILPLLVLKRIFVDELLQTSNSIKAVKEMFLCYTKCSNEANLTVCWVWCWEAAKSMRVSSASISQPSALHIFITSIRGPSAFSGFPLNLHHQTTHYTHSRFLFIRPSFLQLLRVWTATFGDNFNRYFIFYQSTVLKYWKK